jgi:DNA-binding NarL/FixJ family response regulator
MKKKIKVFIADDHTLFREGVKDILEDSKDIEVVGEAENGKEVISKIGKLKPDVLLLDIKLPEIDGIEVTKIVKEKYPQINVLILSAYEDEAHIIDAIRSGAGGYIFKNFTPQQLVNSIRKIAKEGVAIVPNIVDKLVTGVRKIPTKEKTALGLTEHEIGILQKIASGLSNKQIAFELKVSEKTIKNHLTKIYKKLGVKTRAEAVAKGIEKGYISL